MAPSYGENQNKSTLDELESLTTTMPTPQDKDKRNFQDRTIGIFEKMAENTTSLMKYFERNNKLLQNLHN